MYKILNSLSLIAVIAVFISVNSYLYVLAEEVISENNTEESVEEEIAEEVEENEEDIEEEESVVSEEELISESQDDEVNEAEEDTESVSSEELEEESITEEIIDETDEEGIEEESTEVSSETEEVLIEEDPALNSEGLDGEEIDEEEIIEEVETESIDDVDDSEEENEEVIEGEPIVITIDFNDVEEEAEEVEEEKVDIEEVCQFTRDLTLELEGDDVSCLQEYLEINISGIFDEITKTSVLDWQVENDVFPADGYFGIESNVKYLELVDYEVVEIIETITDEEDDEILNILDEKNICQFTRDLTLELEGDDVSCLQEYLEINISGIFDETTKTSVLDWQVENEIEPLDGYWGMESISLYYILNDSDYIYIGDIPEIEEDDEVVEEEVDNKCEFIRTLGIGSEGDDVSCLQEYLFNLGHLELEEGELESDIVSGYFGDRTNTALIEWQELNNMDPIEGYFGELSAELYSELENAIYIVLDINNDTEEVIEEIDEVSVEDIEELVELEEDVVINHDDEELEIIKIETDILDDHIVEVEDWIIHMEDDGYDMDESKSILDEAKKRRDNLLSIISSKTLEEVIQFIVEVQDIAEDSTEVDIQ